MSSPIVIDTRFFIEYLFSSDKNTRERAIRRIKELIKRKTGIVPTIVVSELTKFICQYKGIDDAKVIVYTLIVANFDIVDVDASIAIHAGILKCKNPNVPIGDCIIGAIAKKYNAKVLTDDPHFKEDLKIETIWI